MMMSVVIAAGVRIVFKVSLGKSPCRLVSRALHTRIELDTDIRKRRLRSHADPAANQSVRLYGLKETGQGAVAASVGINDLLADDFSAFHVIKLELFGMPEVLEDRSVSVSYCYSHCFSSFFHKALMDLDRLKFTVTASDQKPLSVYEGVRSFSSCAVIN